MCPQRMFHVSVTVHADLCWRLLALADLCRPLPCPLAPLSQSCKQRLSHCVAVCGDEEDEDQPGTEQGAFSKISWSAFHNQAGVPDTADWLHRCAG